MKILPAALLIFLLMASCGLFKSLNSGTTIKPNDSFILGKNEHGPFKVRLKNNSVNPVEVYHAPINGGKHSGQMVQPGQQVIVKLGRNTALVIANATADTAQVQLKVTGDVGLSMGYKN